MTRTMEKGKKSGNMWGIGIFVFCGAFILFVLGMVLFVSIQDVQLVEESYYERGLEYETRIERSRRTADLDGSLVIEQRPVDSQIVLTVSAADSTSDLSGTIRLIRPSNARLDRKLSLTMDESQSFAVSTADMARGLWLIEVDWIMDSTEYYTETRVVIP